MKHSTESTFWTDYDKLPVRIQRIADQQFRLMEVNPRHPSLRLKKIPGRKNVWSARVTRNYRAVATPVEGGLQWFWIGTHAEYDELLKRLR